MPGELPKRVLAKDPKNARALVLRANALAGLEDLDSAINQIRQALELDPSQSELYSNLGSLEATSGQLDEAEATYKKAIEVAPGLGAAHAALGNFYWATGKGQLAEQAFMKAIEVEPQSVVAHRAAATFYLGSGRPLSAERSLRFVADHSGEFEARLALGDYYLLTGRRDQGVAEIETARKLPVAYAEATTRLIALAYAEGRRQEAEKDLEALLATHPRSPHALLLKARFILRRGENAEALRLATAATDYDDKYIQAYYLAGELHAANGDYFQAAEAYRAVLKLNPFAAPAQIELSRVLLAEGAADSSAEYMNRVLRRVPNDQRTRVSLARALLERRELARAQVQLDELIKQYPGSAPVQQLMGSLSFLKKDYTAARRWYEQSFRTDPSSVDALSGLVGVDLVSNRPNDALARVRAELAKNPKRTPVILLLAKTYGVTKDLPKAEETLRQAIEIDPDNLEAYGMLGQLLYQQGRLDDGRKGFEEIIERQPRSIPAHTMVAIILRQQGRVDEAAERYKKILSIDPQAAVAANNLAWIYAEQGNNYDEAIMLARTAKKKLPDHAEVSDTVGWVYYRAGQPNMLKLGIPYLEESVAKQPQNPLYRYHLGAAYARFGRTAEARTELQQALKISQDFHGAAETRRLLATLD